MSNHSFYSPFYRLDSNHNTIPCGADEVDWGDKRVRVAETRIKTLLERFIDFISFSKYSIGENIRISTVFLVIDHNYSCQGEPMLFETMIFGGKYNEMQERYTTWEKAEVGHNRWVEKVKRNMFFGLIKGV